MSKLVMLKKLFTLVFLVIACIEIHGTVYESVARDGSHYPCEEIYSMVEKTDNETLGESSSE